MWSSKTKLSCIKTELKRCTMTERLWKSYNISRKSPEVPVRRSPKVVRKGRELALNEPWDSTAIGWKIYTSWWGSYISPLYDWQRGLLRRRQTEQKTTNMKMPVCSPRWLPQSRGCLVVRVSMLGSLVKPTVSFVTCIPADSMARATTSFNAWLLLLLLLLSLN